MSKLVRVKPYAPKRGQLVRRIVFRGNLYRGDRGWYEVDDTTAEALSKLEQPASSLYNGPRQPIFDVADVVQAEQIEEAEERQQRATPAKPVRVSSGGGDLTTSDLRPSKPASKPAAQTSRQATRKPKPAKRTRKPRA